MTPLIPQLGRHRFPLSGGWDVKNANGLSETQRLGMSTKNDFKNVLPLCPKPLISKKQGAVGCDDTSIRSALHRLNRSQARIEDFGAHS